MKILFTGSTSFVGKYLIPRLEEQGHKLIHIVRQSQGFAQEIIWDFKGRLPPLPPAEGVIHLATDVDFKSLCSLKQYQVNTVASAKLAAYARDQNAYLVFASAAGVHGQVPIIDETTLVRPQNGYMMSKYLAEEMITLLLPASRRTILRIAGIYGLDGPTHLGLNAAISAAVHQKVPPILKGSGSVKRNYICVIDVAHWITVLLEQYQQGQTPVPSLVYLAGTETLRLSEYLQTIVDCLLPNKEVLCEEGAPGADLVVKASPAPIALTNFRSYLQSL